MTPHAIVSSIANNEFDRVPVLICIEIDQKSTQRTATTAQRTVESAISFVNELVTNASRNSFAST
jgi:hypothetical protein